MIVAMHVQHKGNTDASLVWVEEFDSENTRCLKDHPTHLTSLEFANAVVDYFNSTLKPGERERQVVGAMPIDALTDHS